MSLLFNVGIHLRIKLNQFFSPCGTITIHVQLYLIYSLVKRKIRLYIPWLKTEGQIIQEDKTQKPWEVG